MVLGVCAAFVLARLDGRPVGDGIPGPITMRLRELFFATVRGRNPDYANREFEEVEQDLQERVGMRVSGAGPHLNRQQQERGQDQEHGGR